MRNDTSDFDAETFDEIPYWVEVLYTDGMNARVCSNGHIEEVEDMDVAGLLAVVDEAC